MLETEPENINEPYKPDDRSHHPFRRGDPCPRCGKGKVDYNGLLDLECPFCGYTESQGGGCT